jgi:ABC-type spermidine/putrescine transport system permease subunit I
MPETSMRRRGAILLLAPAVAITAGVFLAPFAFLVMMSVWSQPPGSLIVDTTLTLRNYMRIFGDPFYLRGLAKTLVLAGTTTVACLALGLPLAWWIVRHAGRLRGLALTLVLTPLVCGALLPTLGLVNLLGPLGVVNGTLKWLGLIESTIPLLGHEIGIVIGLVQAFLPLMVLPLVTTLDRMPPEYDEAATSLGARRREVWRHVILPIIAPGVVAGSLLVFFSALTSFVTPQILGQGKVATFATMAFQQASLVLDWPFASALAVTMLAILLLASLMIRPVMRRLARRVG